MANLDGSLMLAAEIDRLSQFSSVAANAPKGAAVSAYLTAGLDREDAMGIADGPYWNLTRQLLQRMSIWWPVTTYACLPVMTPWCIRDRSARYQSGPEMWGSPNPEGFFRDDNSIIKKLPLPLTIAGPDGSPYSGHKPWRGFTACHIWRDLADGSLCGTDWNIYSFMPNLVWLPTALAPMTDHQRRVRAVLQKTSSAAFKSQGGSSVARYTDHAWRRVDTGTLPSLDGALDYDHAAQFVAPAPFVLRRLTYIDNFIAAVDEVLTGAPLSRKVVSSRYTAGLPHLRKDALQSFRDQLDAYRVAVREGISSLNFY